MQKTREFLDKRNKLLSKYFPEVMIVNTDEKVKDNLYEGLVVGHAITQEDPLFENCYSIYDDRNYEKIRKHEVVNLKLKTFDNFPSFLVEFINLKLSDFFPFISEELPRYVDKKLKWAVIFKDNSAVAIISWKQDKFTNVGSHSETNSVKVALFEVNKQLRGIGFGRRAFNFFENEVCANRKCIALRSVDASCGFYQKLGFKCTKEVTNTFVKYLK